MISQLNGLKLFFIFLSLTTGKATNAAPKVRERIPEPACPFSVSCSATVTLFGLFLYNLNVRM